MAGGHSQTPKLGTSHTGRTVRDEDFLGWPLSASIVGTRETRIPPPSTISRLLRPVAPFLKLNLDQLLSSLPTA